MRVFVPRIRRGEQILEVQPATRIQKGDLIALGGRREAVMSAATEIGPEVDDRELLDFPVDVGKLEIGLSQSVGVLLGGPVFG